MEVRQLRANGSTNFVDVFVKIGKRIQKRIDAALKPEKTRSAEVSNLFRASTGSL